MKTWKKLALAATLSAVAGLGFAETLADAKTLIAAAQAEIAAKGLQGAAAEFNSGGKWRTEKSYVVIADFKGNIIAHATNPKLAGKNMLEVKDAAGRPFVQETIATVQGGGESLLDLRWTNPNTKKIDNGRFLARRVVGQDAYVGVSFFE
jgi:cytochrome c